MAEINLLSKGVGSKTVKIIVVIVILAVVGFGIYARVTGLDLHIKSGSISGTAYKGTVYLDKQVELEGDITTIIPSGLGPYYLQMNDVLIDISPVYTTVNRSQPIDHFVKGNIQLGSHIKARLRPTTRDYPEAGGRAINHTYELIPFDPFYIQVTQ